LPSDKRRYFSGISVKTEKLVIIDDIGVIKMDKLDIDNKFIIIPEWILLSNISDKAKVLYGNLWKYADRDTNKCFPSRATLAKNMNCYKSSIDRVLKELIDIKAVSVQNRPPKDNGANQSNLYTLRTISPVFIDKDTPSSTDKDTPVVLDNDLTITNRTKTNITKVRKRDLIFEEICNQCGIDWTKATRGELGRVQKATKELKEINATVEEIKKVSIWYKTNWKNIDITPNGIANNFSNILGKIAKQPKKRKSCDEVGHNWIDLELIFICQYCRIEKSKK
jgi:hypothetical protein